MVVSKMPICVRFLDLHLSFWHSLTFKDDENDLCSYLKYAMKHIVQELFTYAQIYVDIDLSKGLPHIMVLKLGNFKWIQTLDYEITTFRCHTCHDTYHL
jgi:hypothetical protein